VDDNCTRVSTIDPHSRLFSNTRASDGEFQIAVAIQYRYSVNLQIAIYPKYKIAPENYKRAPLEKDKEE
jgi:hypothetical protein